MKLRIKISLVNIIAVMFVSILTTVSIVNIVKKTFTQEMIRYGESIARNLSDRVANAVVTEDIIEIQKAFKEVTESEKIIEYIFVTDLDGKYYYGTFNNSHPRDIEKWNPVNNRSSNILLSTEVGYIRDTGFKVYTNTNCELHVGVRENTPEKTINRIYKIIIAITAVSLLATSILSIIVSGMITKPLEKLHNYIKNMNTQNANVRGSDDEIKELSISFDKMLQELDLASQRTHETFQQLLRTEKLYAIGRLAAGFAHEIKNPLTAMKTILQYIKEDMEKEDADVLLREVERIDGLVNSFLSSAKDNKYNISYFNISELFCELITLINYEAEKKQIALITSVAENVFINADKDMIKQLILNLLLNASEAIPGGGTIECVLTQHNAFIEFSIADSGTGIDENIQKLIFEPFFTTKKDGTGLGLSFAFNAVNLHKGTLDYASINGKTTFIVKLPKEII